MNPLVFVALIPIPIALVFLFLLGRERRPWREAKHRRMALLFALLSFGSTVTGIIHAVRSMYVAVPSDPSEKASLLAAGIAELMNCAAFGVILLVAMIVAALAGRASRRP